MKKIRFFFTVLAILVSYAASAQNITVSGNVKDSSTGEALPFASIQVKGTMIGGNTDLDGNYTINTPADGVLIFSSIGYETLEIAVEGRSTVNLALSPDTQVLEETIVVAFGESTKEAFTGSATVVKSSDIAKVQSSNVTRALEGMVAGVQMTTTSGSLGSQPSIVIRGVSSINAGTAPLYIVDGVPYSGTIDNLNSADIESMTVLKDAASNALYGARGANGVIMITTKKAKSGDAVINFDAKWGWNSKALQEYDYITDPAEYYEAHYKTLFDYNVFNGMDRGDAHLKINGIITGSSSAGGLGYQVFTVPAGEAFIGTNGKVNPKATLGRKYTFQGQDYWITPDNWVDETYRNSLRQEYNLSVSGTTGKASFFASFGYLNNQAITDNSDMQRYTARLRADYQAKEWLKIGANAAYTNYNWNFGGNTDEGSSASTGNVFGFTSGIAPIYPVYLRDGNGKILTDSRGSKRYDFGNLAITGAFRPFSTNANPLQGLNANVSNTEGNALSGTAFADITFLKDFKFTANVGLNMDERRATDAYNPYYGQFATTGGSISKSHGRSFNFNTQQLLSWKRTFANDHNVSVLLGHEYYRATTVSLGASKSVLFSMDNLELNGAVKANQGASSSKDWYNNEGFFGRAQYDYQNRIFVSGSYRRDASSRFHPDHRWGSFWSIGGGWIINEEAWFNAPWIDMLKLKASYGSQGNDSISNYLYTDTYGIGSYDGGIAITPGSKGNPNLTWETNGNFNAGVDFGFWRNRLSGSVEYFYRKTTDMIYFFSVPPSLGYGGYYDNVGDMRNAGVEFAINANVMQRRNLNWNVYVNATHYRNKVLLIPERNKTMNVSGHAGYASGDKFIGEGLSLFTFYIPEYAGVDKTNGLPLYYVDVLNDKNEVIGRETTTAYNEATDYLCGDPTPDLYGGFGTNLEFYGFDVALAFTYQIGGLVYDSGYASLMTPPSASTGSNFHKDVKKAWSLDNPNSDIPRFFYMDTEAGATSSRWLTDASYLNFQNAQIGYTIPAKYTQRIKVSKIRVYVSADNICYVSRRKGLDPRQSFTGATSSALNSPVRTVSGGLSVTF